MLKPIIYLRITNAADVIEEIKSPDIIHQPVILTGSNDETTKSLNKREIIPKSHKNIEFIIDFKDEYTASMYQTSSICENKSLEIQTFSLIKNKTIPIYSIDSQVPEDLQDISNYVSFQEVNESKVQFVLSIKQHQSDEENIVIKYMLRETNKAVKFILKLFPTDSSKNLVIVETDVVKLYQEGNEMSLKKVEIKSPIKTTTGSSIVLELSDSENENYNQKPIEKIVNSCQKKLEILEKNFKKKIECAKDIHQKEMLKVNNKHQAEIDKKNDNIAKVLKKAKEDYQKEKELSEDSYQKLVQEAEVIYSDRKQRADNFHQKSMLEADKLYLEKTQDAKNMHNKKMNETDQYYLKIIQEGERVQKAAIADANKKHSDRIQKITSRYKKRVQEAESTVFNAIQGAKDFYIRASQKVKSKH
ncbi:hypothetical protein CDIK_0955 [Cucumispora dikerogammari]|nr:hypothetical protein CDIK_0955 [Cucumispora dikerogammari]